MSNTTPVVRGFSLHPEQDAIVREYARKRCGGNTSLAVRTIITHFGQCTSANDTEPLVNGDAQQSIEPEAA